MLAIIDADSYVYKAACNCNLLYQLPEGLYIEAYSLNAGLNWFQSTIQELCINAGCDEYILVLGTGTQDFRRVINPNYKANRKKQKRPIMLDKVREEIKKSCTNYQIPMLEADDVCRILSEQYKDSIIISIDKDLRTIPGRSYDSFHNKIRYISPIQAEANFKRQLLMGDSTDGYSGLPGVGPKTADKLLASGITIEDIAQMYLDKGLGIEDFEMVYNMAKIIGNNEYKDGVITLYNGKQFNTRDYKG